MVVKRLKYFFTREHRRFDRGCNLHSYGLTSTTHLPTGYIVSQLEMVDSTRPQTLHRKKTGARHRFNLIERNDRRKPLLDGAHELRHLLLKPLLTVARLVITRSR